jgi:GT2 family glycosyltransferase
VVVTFNSAAHVGALLDSLPDASGGMPLDVVVVDNGSTDGTAELVEARGDCRVVRELNRGYAAGINAGVAVVPDATQILILNPDARVRAGAIPALVAAMERHGAGVVAPRIVDDDGRLFRSLRRAPTLGRASGLGFTGWPAVTEYVTDPGEYGTEHPVDWALGAALLVDARCHRELGGWDESYFLYSEETDFCLRAADAGWVTWYTPTAEVVHEGGGSGRSPQTHAMQIVNRVRLYGRRHTRPSAAVYYLLTVASELTWLARGNPSCRASLAALVRPSRRPAELAAGEALLPR